jgi:tetratricopeptide (TPR) repeat protein
MDSDPTQDTLPTPAVRPAPGSPLTRFVRSVPGAFLIIALSLAGVLALAATAGYYAGSSEHDRAAATAQAAELGRQFQLGLDDLSAGRPSLAVQRFEFILAINPAYPGAAQKLAEARAALPPGVSTAQATDLPSPTMIITVGPDTARQLFEAAQSAFSDKKWDEALQKIGALRVIDQNYERAAVHSMQFKALQFRAIAYIDAGKLELGLADLDQASKMGSLTEDAQQHQQWAEIYIAGVSYWGLNWARTVETFQLLYKIAPYFRDTSTRLHDAQLAYARQLDAQGQPCDAVVHYSEALKLQPDPAVNDKQTAAQNACQNGTPTPNGSETATPGTPAPGSPTPGATATASSAPANTATAAATATSNPPTDGVTATTTASPTNTASPTSTTAAATATTAPAATDTATPTATPTNTPTGTPAATLFLTFFDA